ncbi:hypothetical protein [Yoonia sp.]|uniref:hypothetical protein n=1 Tax=Yoonia sp. TaxID=2212373 RepID=UPI0019F3055D|nr:hypothetical protein [Yoonia sp.]MBE0414450.1 hypothetical protein [Yoonia sp.]
MKSMFSGVATLVLMGACAAPTPPSISQTDLNVAFAEATRISALPATSYYDLPTGSVTYDGQIGANVTGDAQGQMLADMTMVVRFDSNAMGGTVSNMNLMDTAGLPEQRLDGKLTIAGFESAGTLGGVAAGQISGVNSGGRDFDADMVLDLSGSVVNDRWYGDAVYGSATGATTGDVNLGVTGVFFGTER